MRQLHHLTELAATAAKTKMFVGEYYYVTRVSNRNVTTINTKCFMVVYDSFLNLKHTILQV